MDGVEANRPTRVLIVDDVETNRIILEEILQDVYETQQASDGFEAISLMFNEEQKPDLVLLDVMMPDMDGFEVFSVMKNNPLTARIPVIFITASAGTESEQRALTLGAIDYITKPFVPEIVKLRVNNCIELDTYRRSLESEVERKLNELVKTKENILDLLASIIDYRDSASGDHVKRTLELAEVLVDAMLKTPRFRDELIEQQYEVIIRATATHDIGKIAVPDAILLKPGPLTKEEFEVIKTHTLIGEQIVQFMKNSLDDVYYKHCHDVCLSHHERWDGRGYPHGISGLDIPLAARIMAVVDVYEALTSARPYKQPFDKPTALKMISEGAGTQFDPDIVEMLLSVSSKL